MKRQLLLIGFLMTSFTLLKAQTVSDTVSVGSGYSNQVWYNLNTGTETVVSGTSWDLGFQISGFSSAIIANTAYGAELYKYPNGDTGNWATLDTMGISNWEAWHDPSDTWEWGAFNQGLDTSNAFDLGWGKYNFITHRVTGDSLYVWKTANGAIYKIWIQVLSSGTYYFLVSDYSGNNVDTVALAKSNFAGKNFGYYNIAQDSILDLEPLTSDWDLVFSKYIEDIGTPYSVSGIRTNIGVEAAQVYPVNSNTYTNALAHTYSSETNIIGHDWKSFDFGCFCYLIEDSTVYFLKTDTNTYWKLVMKGFTGSTTGEYHFEKTLLNTTTGITKSFIPKNGNVVLYPNPSTSRTVSLVLDLPDGITTTQLNILNVNGQIIRSEQLQVNSNLEVHALNLENLNSGIYFLQLNHQSGSVTKRLILK